MLSSEPLATMALKVPTSISPVPIAQAIAEIRFESPVPAPAILGVAYSRFKNDFPEIKPLPIANMPSQIIENNPALAFSPTHQLVGPGKNIIQIGPQSFSVLLTGEYTDWTSFKKTVIKAFTGFLDASIVTTVTRIALRYTDFFSGDIFPNINPTFQINGTSLVGRETSFRTIINWEGFDHILQVNNSAKKINTTPHVTGSVIDIDTINFHPSSDIKSTIENDLQKMHDSSIHLFFSLLKEEYVRNNLNPKYA